MTRVTLENVRVDFPIYGAQRSLRKAIFERAAGGIIRREGKNQERVVVRALDDVSFELREGDRLGLMGHNGSGKSTLLKVLAGIYEPVAGRMTIEGRVTPLFDMLPGLDPEDTGYENIFTAGMLLGMSRDFLEAKIPEIEEFSELGEYLTLPVRTYSAGMTLRLGFAVVTALEPGILLMDEGFGTGDLRFAERAAERMDGFIGRSRILVLASHSDAMIKSICNKALLMKEGSILSVGPVDDICEQYHELIHGPRLAVGVAPIVVEEEREGEEASLVEEEREGEEASLVEETNLAEELQAIEPQIPEEPEKKWVDCGGHIEDLALKDRLARSNGAARLVKITAHDTHGTPRWDFLPGETATFRFVYRVLQDVENLAMLFRLNVVSADEGAHEIVFAELCEVLSSEPVEAGYEGIVELSFRIPDLLPSRFSPYAWLGRVSCDGGYDVVDANVGLPAFEVRPSTVQDLRCGLLPLAHEAKKRIADQSAIAKVD